MYHGLVLGNEPRQTMTAARLKELGAKMQGDGTLDFLVLPMHCEEVPDAMKQLRPGGICFGIRPGREVALAAEEQGLRMADLNEDPSFKRRNAISTAEAALALAVGNTEDTLFGCQVLVAGFGAIGSRLCRLLTGLGAKVTCSARKAEDLVQIVVEGARAVHTDALAETARPYSVIFNTVPSPVLTAGLLEKQSKDCLVLDLASGSGGLAPGLKPDRYIQALGLPGKTAPMAAARAAADTIWDRLEERHAQR